MEYSISEEQVAFVKSLLQERYRLFNTAPEYAYYKYSEPIINDCADKVLKSGKRDDIISLTLCLDTFYSAGLRYIPRGTERVGDFLFHNWNKGLQLNREIHASIAPGLVDETIKLLQDELKKDVKVKEKNYTPYSFISKFFHRFHPGYYIYDSYVRQFLSLLDHKHSPTAPLSYAEYHKKCDKARKQFNYSETQLKEWDLSVWVFIKEMDRGKKNPPGIKEKRKIFNELRNEASQESSSHINP